MCTCVLVWHEARDEGIRTRLLVCYLARPEIETVCHKEARDDFLKQGTKKERTRVLVWQYVSFSMAERCILRVFGMLACGEDGKYKTENDAPRVLVFNETRNERNVRVF